MKTTKKALIAVGVAATLGLGATAANAGVLASSTFTIHNFIISDVSTGNALTLANFDSLVATNNAGISASLVGVGSDSANFNLAFTNPNTDLTAVCVGSCATQPAENTFNVLLPPPTGTFAHADENLTGSSIDIGAGAGADAQVRADVALATQRTRRRRRCLPTCGRRSEAGK